MTLALAALVITIRTQAVWCSCVSIDSRGVESALSREVSLMTTNKRFSVAWNPIAGSAGYAVYGGTNGPLNYQWRQYVGDALSANLPVWVGPPVTNYAALYAQSGPSPLGPFSDVAAGPFAVLTNTVGEGLVPEKQFYRIRVWSGTNAP